MFGGYPWRYYRSVNNQSFEEYAEKYYAFWQRLIPENQLNRLVALYGKDIITIDERETFNSVFSHIDKENISPEQCINYSMYFEAKTFLHGLFVVEDKLSMANGLETRVPFMDNDLVDFAMKVPVRLKLSNLRDVVRLNENEAGLKTSKYYMRTKYGKIILRKAMKDIIPLDITDAVKQGFTPPDQAWFKGESIDYIKSVVFDSNACMYNYIDKNIVQKLVQEHLEGKNNWRLFVWSVLVFRQWCDLFITSD